MRRLPPPRPSVARITSIQNNLPRGLQSEESKQEGSQDQRCPTSRMPTEYVSARSRHPNFELRRRTEVGSAATLVRLSMAPAVATASRSADSVARGALSPTCPFPAAGEFVGGALVGFAGVSMTNTRHPPGSNGWVDLVARGFVGLWAGTVVGMAISTVACVGVIVADFDRDLVTMLSVVAITYVISIPVVTLWFLLDFPVPLVRRSPRRSAGRSPEVPPLLAHDGWTAPLRRQIRPRWS